MAITQRNYYYSVQSGDVLEIILKKHGIKKANGTDYLDYYHDEEAWDFIRRCSTENNEFLTDPQIWRGSPHATYGTVHLNTWNSDKPTSDSTGKGADYIRQWCQSDLHPSASAQVEWFWNNTYKRYRCPPYDGLNKGSLIVYGGEQIWIPDENQQPQQTWVDYKVKRHDSIPSIAAKIGTHWKTIWDYSGNAAVKSSRDMFVLYPGKNDYPGGADGDIVKVPATTTSTTGSGAQTNARRLVAGLVGLKTKLVLYLQHDGQAVDNRYFELVSTTPDIRIPITQVGPGGKIEIEFKETAIVTVKELTLYVFEYDSVHKQKKNMEEHTLLINDIDPIDTVSGIQARLNNLGFECGDVTNVPDDKLANAIKAFEKHKGYFFIKGEWTRTDFQNDLKTEHGC